MIAEKPAEGWHIQREKQPIEVRLHWLTENPLLSVRV
jgi:hypothetical protein